MMLPEEVSNLKSRKKKTANLVAPLSQVQGDNFKGVQQTLKSKKALKQSMKSDISPPAFQHQERSSSDSLPGSSREADEYRALRRKYLLLEDENFELGKELQQVEDEVKILEDEKLALLDQLVVLEGLVDPSEIQTRRTPQV